MMNLPPKASKSWRSLVLICLSLLLPLKVYAQWGERYEIELGLRNGFAFEWGMRKQLALRAYAGVSEDTSHAYGLNAYGNTPNGLTPNIGIETRWYYGSKRSLQGGFLALTASTYAHQLSFWSPNTASEHWRYSLILSVGWGCRLRLGRHWGTKFYLGLPLIWRQTPESGYRLRSAQGYAVLDLGLIYRF